MRRSDLVLILIAFAALGCSNGIPMGEDCDDPLICIDKPSTYDLYQDHIDHIVKQNKALMTTEFYDDSLGDVERMTTGDKENCVAVTTVERPFIIKTNVSSEYVIQSKHFEQKIRITRCENLESPCLRSVKTPGFGIKTYCDEKFGTISLYIYDPVAKEIKYKMFQIPICCTCKLVTENYK